MPSSSTANIRLRRLATKSLELMTRRVGPVMTLPTLTTTMVNRQSAQWPRAQEMAPEKS